MFRKLKVLFYVWLLHLKKNKTNSLLLTGGFVDLQEAMWSSLLMPHGRRAKMVGENWEEVQRQREHGVPFLQVGAVQRRLSTPSAFGVPPLNDLVWDTSPNMRALEFIFGIRWLKNQVLDSFFPIMLS